MSSIKSNPSNRNALIVVYLAGALTTLIGLAGLFIPSFSGSAPNPTLTTGIYIATVICGIAILVTASFVQTLTLAEYLTCTSITLLASAGLAIDSEQTAAIMGYTVSIALAGVLISGSTIPILSGISIAAYIIVLISSPQTASHANPVVVIAAIVITAALLTVFANSQRHTAEEAKQNAEAANRKSEQLEAAFGTQRRTRNKALNLATQLSETSNQQKGSAETAAAAISQVTAQSAELSAAAAQIASAARLIRDTSDRTREMAGEARSRLDSDREQLNQAVQAGEQLQEAARGVSDKVKQMSQILNLITEVAEETHMLSLNATIEATGTGEAGRRFRVIAAEVGNLAGKVNNSTEQVTAIVQNVQRTAQQMLITANQTVDSIRRSQLASAGTSEQIEQVSTAAGDVAREGFLIGSSTEQQRRSTELIVDAMQNVSSMAHQAADSSKQLQGVAAELTEVVDELVAGIPTDNPTSDPPSQSLPTRNPTQNLNPDALPV